MEGRIMNDDIGRRFLEDIDFYIKNNIQSLTCSHINLFARL
jgi:hypothetical protein